MKKRLLTLLLSIMLVVSMMPVTAFAVTGTWDVDLAVSKNSTVKYNEQDTVEIGFGVQSDDLTLSTVQSIVFAVDLNVFDFVYAEGDTATSYMSAITSNLDEITDVVYTKYQSGSGPSAIKWDAKVYVAEKGSTGFMVFQPHCTKNTPCQTQIVLASILLGFKTGKGEKDITSSSIRLATAAEARDLAQGQVISLTDGKAGGAVQKYGTGGTDTLTGTVQVKWNGITPAKPAYSGTIAAPTVASNKGGEVVLNAAVLTPADSAAKIQYGYSNSASTAPTNWEDSTTFSGLTVGETLYFYAKVVETADHAEKVSAASASVEVADKPALQGSVTINNTNPKFGDTLEAITTALDYNGESAGTLTYQWYRGDEKITDATGKTYQVDAADMNKAIKIEVKNSNNSVSVFSEATALVAKAAGPAAPTGLDVVSVTDATITVTPNAAWEYSKDNGGNWQDSNVFTGLAPNNLYSQIVARVKETATHNAGAKSAAITATTAMASANEATIAQLKATHTVYNAEYDGTAHPAFSSVATLPSGWTSTYSRTEAGTYGALPMVTNVADSGKIYVKFSHTSYADVIAEYTVTVSPAPLSITAKDHTITYSEAPANNGVTISGFVNSETDAVLTGTKDYGYGTYVQYSDAGNYPIVPKNYEAANYHITFHSGTLEVQPKEVGLTWSNHTGRKFADGLTVTAAATGTVNSDVINVTVTGGDETAVGDHIAIATALTGEKKGNYKLPAATTQNYNIAKADAQTLANKTISVKHSNTAEQTVSVAGLMPPDAGTLTYTQGTLTGDTGVIDTWNVTTGGKVTFTLKTGADAAKTVTLPVTINSDNYAASSVKVVVKTIAKDVPDVKAQDITVTYTGSAVPNSAIKGTATVEGTPIAGSWEFKAGETVTNVAESGSKIVVFKPTDTANYAEKTTTINVTINKAKPTGAPVYTKITAAGKTLAAAALATGTITPSGTIKWVEADETTMLPDTTPVVKNQAYNWLFTPADPANYNTLTGKLTPYYVASSGGSYVPKVQKPEITIIGSGKADLSADGRTATITAAAGHELVSVVLNGKEMGKVEKLTGLKTGDKATITFRAKTDGKAEMDKIIAQKASKLTLMARSKKTAKLNIKVVVKGDLKAITDAGYTVKYKFYRSTKKSAGYKAVLTKKAPTYYNTYGKKGTMYYYKARVMIYDKDGNFVAQTALKQCKYANRLWTK